MSRAARHVAVAASFALLALVPTAQAAPGIFLAQQPFSTGAGSAAAEPAAVAFDGSGDATAAYLDADGTTLDVADRTFGQVEFGPRAAIGTVVGTLLSGPVISADARGDVAVGWVAQGYDGQSTAWVASRAAGETVFGAPVAVTPAGDRPQTLSLFATDDGNTTAVWRSGPVRAATRTSAGSSFGEPQTLSGPATGGMSASAASNGALAVGWSIADPQSGGVVAQATRRPAGAASFEAPQTSYAPQSADEHVLAPTIAVGPDASVTAVSTVRHGSGAPDTVEARTAPPAGPFTAQALPNADLYGAHFSALGTDRPGHLTAVWTGGTDHRMRFTGAWQEQQQALPVDPAATISNVRLSPDAAGGQHVLWVETKNGVPTLREAYRPPYSVRYPGAIPTITNFTLVDGFAPVATTAAISADPFGHATVTWGRSSALIDRAGPLASEIQGPDRVEIDHPAMYSLTATDTFSPPVTAHWVFDDGGTADGLTVTHTFSKTTSNNTSTKPKPGTLTATVTDAAGNPTTRTFVTTAFRIGPANAKNVTPAPTFSMALSTTTFKPVRKAKAQLDRAPSTAKTGGTTITVNASAAGDVTFDLERYVRGHVSGKKCSTKPIKKRAGKHAKACTRAVDVDGEATATVPAGATKLRLTGRWGRKPLPAGRYRLTGFLAAGGTSQPSSVDIRIRR